MSDFDKFMEEALILNTVARLKEQVKRKMEEAKEAEKNKQEAPDSQPEDAEDIKKPAENESANLH